MQENIENQLRNQPFSYRDRLTLPREVRFGLEIELENIDYNKVYTLVRKKFGTSFKIKPDRSLLYSKNAEIATPVFRNDIKTWKLLSKLGEYLSKLEPTFCNCGFQVNFDGCLLPSEDDKIRFLKLFAYYEDIIYRFSKGEDLSYRDTLDVYAAPIILTLKDVLEEKDKSIVLERFSDNKRYGVVFKTKQDLIEFRSPNGTVNPALWQNYVTLFYYLLRFVFSNKYNQREIDAYIHEYGNMNVLESYEIYHEEKALKLAKVLFNKQEDRCSFLHHYRGLGR